MPDFLQHDLVTTIHDLQTGTLDGGLESMLREATKDHPIGLVLRVTAGDMRAEPFGQIVDQLVAADYIDTIIGYSVWLQRDRITKTVSKVQPLQRRSSLKCSGPTALRSSPCTVSSLKMDEVSSPGKRSKRLDGVWISC